MHIAIICSQGPEGAVFRTTVGNLIGFFRKNKLARINVNGNGQTIYYLKDEGELIGVNKAESSNIIIYLNNHICNCIYFIYWDFYFSNEGASFE